MNYSIEILAIFYICVRVLGRKGEKMSNIHLPKIPVLRVMHCEDHATFVVSPEHRDEFLVKHARRGLVPMPAIVTKRFIGEHIALVEKPGGTQTCERMVGVSSSTDPNSPVNKLCRLARHGGVRGVLQHIAYAVDVEADFCIVRRDLESRGVNFMTPILTYTDPNGASIRQMFVACKVPFGPFIEIIQRTRGPNGVPFQGFNADQIDGLYYHYNEYSLWLAQA